VISLLFFWKNEEVEEWPPTNNDNDALDTPEKNLTKDQQQGAAIEHLKKLSPKQQQCFLLRSWEGLSVADTADIMQCSQGSVKTHYFRAVSKLRTMMEDDHEITF